MAHKQLILDLGKLLIAAAWADGELSTAELNGLKELLFQWPDISGEEWMELELYMASPVNEEERQRVFHRVLEGITSNEDRELVLKTLQGLMPADAEEDHPQAAVLQELREDIEQGSQGVWEHLRRPLRWMLRFRGQHYSDAQDREGRLEDFIKNTIYFQVTNEMRARGQTFNLHDADIRKLCLAAGLMARVAGVDRHVSKKEMLAIQEILKTVWHLSGKEAHLVAEISHHRVFQGLDAVRLVKGFNEYTTTGERKEFLNSLFAVANASNKTSYEEIEEIRSLAKGMELSHQDFIEAKLRVSREDRGGL